MGRSEIIKVIYQRLKEVESEDGRLAYRAVVETQGEEYTDALFQEYKEELHHFAQRYYPYRMAITLLLQPLRLGRGLEGR